MIMKVTSLPRVVVLGGGYAGVETVESLRGEPVDLTLIDRKPYHTEKTKLWKLALGKRKEGTEPLEKVARKAGARLQLGEVQSIDAEAREVRLQGGSSIPYDYLVVALGSTPSRPEGGDGVLTLDQPEDAVRISETVAARAREARAEGRPLSIVVVGGGATGVELAGLAREIARRESPSGQLDLQLLHSGPRLVNGMPDKVARQTAEALSELGVEVRYGQRVASVEPGQVQLQSGEVLKADCVLWATGTRAPELLAELGPTDRAGRVEVTEHLNLPDHPEVFIVGDAALARCAGQTVPPDKRAARKTASHTAQNLHNALRGRPLEPFRYRDDKGHSHIGPVELS